MAFPLRMSEEIGDWLIESRQIDPAAALRTGQALAALMIAEGTAGPAAPDQSPGFPLIAPGYDVAPASYDRLDPVIGLDFAYQRGLERTQDTRRRAAAAAAEVRRAESRIADLAMRQAADEGGQVGAELADLVRLLPGLRDNERVLDSRAQEEQREADSFRIRKEARKASYLTARAITMVGDLAGDDGSAAFARLREARRQIEAELGWRPLADGLSELRTDPLGADPAILFAIEPPGAVLLIAVIERPATAVEQYVEAAQVASDVLEAVRAGSDSDASALAFDDPAAFAAWLLPDRPADVEAGAAELAAGSRGRTLAQLRDRAGLTRAGLAERMGVRPETIAAIERAVSGGIEIRDLAAYVGALGGRLEIVADFGGERVTLR